MPVLPLAEVQPRPRLPEWLRIRLPTSDSFARTRRLLDELKLHTVCESARCPNHWECWTKGTATFMIAGDRCTRACGFCAVTTAKPFALEADEPARVAEATHRMRLKHVVITAVARDDLADGGAEHFRKTINSVRALSPQTVIEVLVPDFNDREEAIEIVLAAHPDIFNHNLETVRRLTPTVRSRATYDRSLSVLAKAKERSAAVLSRSGSASQPRAEDSQAAIPPGPLNLVGTRWEACGEVGGGFANPGIVSRSLYTKSGLMLGLGETDAEVLTAMRDLREVGCDILTLGQYLQPTRQHLPVVEFVSPERFAGFGARAGELGFIHVASGPLVRSSYHADEFTHPSRAG